MAQLGKDVGFLLAKKPNSKLLQDVSAGRPIIQNVTTGSC